jgi:hypothetical protein
MGKYIAGKSKETTIVFAVNEHFAEKQGKVLFSFV